MRVQRLALNLQFFAQEKTEKATPKKRRDAREKGRVAKSMEIPGAFILLFSFLALALMGEYFRQRLFQLFRLPLQEYLLWELTESNLQVMAAQVFQQIFLILLPIMLIAVVIALVSNYLQVGFLFTGHPLMPKLSKLNPIAGAKNIFSLRAGVEFLKALIKVMIIGSIVYMTLWAEKDAMLALAAVPLPTTLQFVAGLTVSLGLKVGACLVVIALLDYAYQKYDFEKKLRMSKQEIKDEHKKTEGDPLVRARIRERQRKMAMQRMMQEVPKADVVITNPTHLAVALKYDEKKMDAPVVIAKGQDYLALKIREIARKHDIVTMENKPLAQALYAEVELGQSIPAHLFQAVAEVLAYVYRLKGKASRRKGGQTIS